MKTIVLSISLLCFTASLTAQLILPEFGKPDEAWFAEHPYAADSAVHAYVIAQKTEVEMGVWGGQLARVTKIRRIVRVLDAQGYDEATFRKREFDPEYGGGKLTIRESKAITYRMQNGNIEESEVSEKDFFKNRLTSGLSEISFSFPNVREGSVLDMELEIVGVSQLSVPYAMMQEEIPIQEIEFKFKAHEYLEFSTTTHGYFPVTAQRSQERTKDASVIGNLNVITLRASDVPALAREPFVSSLTNYAAHCKIELKSYRAPGIQDIDVASDWPRIVGNINTNRNLQEAIKGKGYYKEWAANLPSSLTTEEEKAAWALKEVNKLMSWNGYESCYPDKKASTSVEKREGDTGDINTLLLGLNKALGLKSYPVALSSLDNGWLVEFYPNQSSLNTMVVATELNGKMVYSDASSPKAILGVLPSRDLNGRGIMMKDDTFVFVDLQDGAVAQQGLQANLLLDDDGYLSGTISYTIKGNSMMDKTEMIDGELDVDKSQLAIDENFTLSQVKVVRERNDTYLVTAEVKSREPLTQLGNSLILDPHILKFRTANPFLHESRSYPIEFQSRIIETRDVIISLPVGTKLEVPAEPLFVKTSDGKGMFRHSIKESDTGIQLSTLFAVKGLIFLPESYPEIQGLFSQSIEKEAEVLSLVKQP